MIKIHPSIYYLLALLFMIGTFFDLPISEAVFNPESSFSWFFQNYGYIPSLCLASVAAMILAKQTQRVLTRGLFIITAGVLLLIIYFIAHISIIYLLLAAVVIGWLSNYYYRLNQWVAVLWSQVVLSTLIASNAVVQLMKMIWGRPRFKYMIEPATDFIPWYQLNGLTMDDALMSLPSGHSMNGTLLIGLILLVKLHYPQRSVIKWSAQTLTSIWIIAMMVSRIIYGNHFLTDTVIGTTLTLLIFQYFQDLYFNNNSLESKNH